MWSSCHNTSAITHPKCNVIGTYSQLTYEVYSLSLKLHLQSTLLSFLSTFPFATLHISLLSSPSASLHHPLLSSPSHTFLHPSTFLTSSSFTLLFPFTLHSSPSPSLLPHPPSSLRPHLPFCLLPPPLLRLPICSSPHSPSYLLPSTLPSPCCTSFSFAYLITRHIRCCHIGHRCPNLVKWMHNILYTSMYIVTT